MEKTRFRSLAVAVVLSLCTIGVLPQAQAEETIVVAWNEAMLQAIRDTRPGPPIVARMLAITHTCMYDAWAAYDSVAVGTRLGGPCASRCPNGPCPTRKRP